MTHLNAIKGKTKYSEINSGKNYRNLSSRNFLVSAALILIISHFLGGISSLFKIIHWPFYFSVKMTEYGNFHPECMFLPRNKQTNKQLNWLPNLVHGKELAFMNILSLHCHLTSPPTPLFTSCWTCFSKIPVSYNTNSLTLFLLMTCSKLWHKTTSSNLFQSLRHPIQRKENEVRDQRVIIIGTIKMSMISFTP